MAGAKEEGTQLANIAAILENQEKI